MKTKRKIWWTTFTLLVAVGTYNAVVINTHSRISKEDVPFIKGLDEMYGVSTPGRTVATRHSWKKIDPIALESTSVAQVELAPEVVEESRPEAAITEQLKLELVEVSNPQKWKEGLTTIDFDGNLSTSNGVLEAFEVSLPSGEEISVAYMEMNGNTFSYDLDGEVYNAMIFQADQHSYIVSMGTGPLEGTRMRFQKAPTQEQLMVRETLRVEHNIQVGNFGVNTVNTQQSAALSPEAELPMQVHSFNFDQEVL